MQPGIGVAFAIIAVFDAGFQTQRCRIDFIISRRELLEGVEYFFFVEVVSQAIGLTFGAFPDIAELIWNSPSPGFFRFFHAI